MTYLCHSGRCRGAALAGTLLILFGTSFGCGQSGAGRVAVYPVEGKVLLKGQPLEHALVVLHPRHPGGEAATAPSARAQTDATGTFVLTTYENRDGAAAGEYAVTVQHYPLVKTGESYAAGPNSLPQRIATPETTDIFVKVAEGPNTLQPIEIRR